MEAKIDWQREITSEKLVPDLRNNIRTDLRKSLKTDLRVHLNKRNQRTVSKAKQPIQDLRSRLSRPRAADQTEKEEGYLYMRRADMEEDVEEENLFTRKSDEENYVIHVSEAQKEEPNSSRDLMSEANEYCVYSSEGSTYENITRTIKKDYYFDLLDKRKNPKASSGRTGPRLKRQQLNNGETPEKPNHGMPINKKSRNKCPVPGCKASNQPTEKRDSKEAHRFVLNCPKLHGMNRKECWDFYKESKCKCKKCFSTEHEWDSCPLQKNFPKFCKDKKKDGTICGGEHHELLHYEPRKKRSTRNQNTETHGPDSE